MDSGTLKQSAVPSTGGGTFLTASGTFFTGHGTLFTGHGTLKQQVAAPIA